ncbi:MAG: murein biosynthesis integral membrane protein MurJ [Chloroflexi bacterium]|nr:MAG: murein biosynthesis integral membrane protein MurJ [Chloroflexota bacterium]
MRRWGLRQYGISDAAVIMAAAFALSAVLGMFRQMLIVATFGDGSAVAAYYAAARLPETIINFVAGGALTTALVPLLLAEPTHADQERLLNTVSTMVLSGVALFALVAQLGVSWFVTMVLLPGGDAATQQLTITLTRILLLQPVLLALVSIVSALLTAQRRFTLIATAYVSYNLMIIAGILLARWWPAVGVYGPTIGLVLAAVIKIIIVLIGLRWVEMPLRWRWQPHLPQLHTVLWLAAPTALSVTVNYAGTIVDTSFASQLGVATVAAIYSAWLLTDMPARLLGSAIGQSVFPHLAAAIVERDFPHARRIFGRTTALAVGLTLPVIGLTWWLGRWGIQIVLERGAFDAAAGDRVFVIWQWYVLGLPAFVLTELLSRMLNAMRDTRTPLLTNTAQLGAKWALLMNWGPVAAGLAVPIAHVVTCYAETVVLAMVVWRRFYRGIDENR